jgi:exopolysaccharide biosynthesis polyprenyl glycosylphosphotransferase
MTPPSTSAASVFDEVPVAAPRVAHLPKRDVRRALDAAVRRGWTEATRRAARIVCLLLMDTLAGIVGIATVTATWWLVDANGARPLPNTIPLLAMVFCIQPLALRATGAYGGGAARASLFRVGGAMLIAAVIGWIQAQLFGRVSPDLPNKTAYLYSAALITLYAWSARVAFDLAVQLGFKAGVFQRRVLLIGHRDDIEDAQRRVDYDPASDVRVVAAMSPRMIDGNLEALDKAIASSRAHAVVVAASLPAALLEKLMSRCFENGIGVSLVPGRLQAMGSVYFELGKSHLGLLLQVFPMRFGLPQLAVKRTMDLTLTLVGLAVIWPLLAIIAIAIKLDSPGPVLFRQTRAGVGGRSFRILKFRTMVVDAEAQKAKLAHLNEYGDGKLFKIKNDPRITRIGRFLRKTSLDELPQLWNVVCGEMSLVGPRPCVPSELRQYAPHHMVRLHVVPGVTGPWQVGGRNNVLDFEEVVRMEQEYIRSWSLRKDLLILAKTVPTLLGKGAY